MHVSKFRDVLAVYPTCFRKKRRLVTSLGSCHSFTTTIFSGSVAMQAGLTTWLEQATSCCRMVSTSSQPCLDVVVLQRAWSGRCQIRVPLLFYSRYKGGVFSSGVLGTRVPSTFLRWKDLKQGKDCPLPHTSTGAKSNPVLSLETERNLSIARQKIQGREILTVRKGLQSFVDPWQWICIVLSHVIESAIIYAKTSNCCLSF